MAARNEARRTRTLEGREFYNLRTRLKLGLCRLSRLTGIDVLTLMSYEGGLQPIVRQDRELLNSVIAGQGAAVPSED